LLAQFGVSAAYHYAPMHYLAFIARAKVLLSKSELRNAGFQDAHFRSTSKKQDEERGFARYVHLTLDAHPAILRAKLQRGFPHFEVAVAASTFEGIDYLLCRFNIAKARYFKGAKAQPSESPKNGRYIGDLRLPVAATPEQREVLLKLNYGINMIELLVPERLNLESGVVFRFFHVDDLECAKKALGELGISAFQVKLDESFNYERDPQYAELVRKALSLSISDPAWRGNGIEFDRV
jgi:hypothetical protein